MAQVNLEIVLIKNLEDAAFEVLRFRRGRQNRMVAPLRAVLDLTQLHMRIVRRVADNLHERIRQNVLRAGAGNQVAAGLDHLHCTQVDFLVAARRRGPCGVLRTRAGRESPRHT